jgi:murein L,D-transpeptidase YcbB/YkuD
MKLNKETIKKLAPFGAVGLLLGMGVFMGRKDSSSTSTTSTDTDTTDINQIAGAMSEQLKSNMDSTLSAFEGSYGTQLDSMADQTNTAFEEQKTYYDSLVGSLSGKLDSSNQTISGLTDQLHDVQTKLSGNQVSQTTTPTTATTTVPSSYPGLLKIGSKGDSVKKLQETLVASGYNISVDGIYGKQTATAVKDVQQYYGIKVDGVTGQDTWGHIYG